MEVGYLVLEYGFEVVLIALVSILLVGSGKIAFKKPLEKIEKGNRKIVYEIASIIIVAVLSVLWVLLNGGGAFPVYATKILAAYGGMKVIYPLYENFKIRDLVQLIGKLIKQKHEEKSNE